MRQRQLSSTSCTTTITTTTTTTTKHARVGAPLYMQHLLANILVQPLSNLFLAHRLFFLLWTLPRSQPRARQFDPLGQSHSSAACFGGVPKYNGQSKVVLHEYTHKAVLHETTSEMVLHNLVARWYNSSYLQGGTDRVICKVVLHDLSPRWYCTRY